MFSLFFCFTTLWHTFFLQTYLQKSFSSLIVCFLSPYLLSDSHPISMLYPTLVLVQGHLSSSPVYLLMLLFNSKCLPYICHCFCTRISSLQIISHYILPPCQNLTQWLLMLLPHLFQLLLPPLWPGSPAVVVS